MMSLIDRRSVVFFATGLVLAAEGARSQEKPEFIDAATLSDIGGRLSGTTKELMARFAERAEGEWIKELDDDIGRLFNVLFKVQVSKFYAEMLEYDATILGKAVKEDDLDKVTDYVRISHEDIKVKLRGIEFQINWGATSSDISVEINTITTYSKKPVNGFEISFYMLGTGTSAPPFRVFKDLTTPSKDSVPPGHYIIHVIQMRNSKREVRLATTRTIWGRQPEEKIEIGIG